MDLTDPLAVGHEIDALRVRCTQPALRAATEALRAQWAEACRTRAVACRDAYAALLKREAEKMVSGGMPREEAGRIAAETLAAKLEEMEVELGGAIVEETVKYRDALRELLA